MKMTNRYVEKACGTKHKTKSHMREPYLDVENARLLAMNDVMTAVIPVLVEPSDEAGHIPVDVFASARKMATKCKTRELEIDASDTQLATHYKPESRADMGAPEDVDRVIRSTGPRRHAVTLSAEHLLNLAKAVNYKGGGTSVTLHLPEDPSGVVMVTPLNPDPNVDKNLAFGLLCPILAGDAQND